MNRSVGITYAITGAVTAAAMLVVTAATFGLGGEAAYGRTGPVPGRAEGVGVPKSVATASAIVPAGMLRPDEQIVSAEVVQTDAGPIHYVTVEPAPAAAGARRSHDDDDDEDEHEEHEERREREHEDREYSSRTRRESR